MRISFAAYDQLDQEQQKCLAHLLSAIIEIIVTQKENDRIEKTLDQHAQAVEKEQQQAIGDSPVKKPRGRPPKQAKLDENALENLDQRKVANLKTLDQRSRLCAFFRQVFENTVIGWKTPQADRISAEQGPNN